MTTHSDALGDYQRYRARQAGDPPPSAAPPDPAAARKAAERHAISLLTPAPRDALRQAHAQRTDAQHGADRLRQALARAKEHQASAIETRDGAQQGLEAVEAADTARLIEELAVGGSAGRAPPGAGAERIALAECEHQLEIATRAVDKLAGDLATAEQRLSTAEAKITQAVCAVLLDLAQAEAEAIVQAADDLDSRRAGLDALGVVITSQQRRTGAARQPWPAAIHLALQPDLR